MTDEVELLAVAYINEHAAELHGTGDKAPDTGGDLTAKSIVNHRIENDDTLVVVANRGVKGSPKYVIPLIDLERFRGQTQAKPKPKAKPKTRAKPGSPGLMSKK